MTPTALEPPLRVQALRQSFYQTATVRRLSVRQDLYRERNLVKRFINKINYRRIAARYEKTVVSSAAVLLLVATMIWLK
jgi:transposase